MLLIVVFWRWYYGEAIKNVLTAWRNFILFALNYFSIPLLLKTLFAPWKRDITKRPRGLNLKKFFEYLTFNLISRSVGFLVRIFMIVVGTAFLIITIVAGAVFFALWIILPLVLLGLLIFGFSCLI